MPDPPGSTVRRNRSSTMVGPTPIPDNPSNPSRPSQIATTPRNITEPTSSAAAAALSSHLATPGVLPPSQALGEPSSLKRPRLSSSKTSHARVQSWPDQLPPVIPNTSITTSTPSAPVVPTRRTLEHEEEFGGTDRARLCLYTYRPNNTASQSTQPSPLPAAYPTAMSHPSMIHFAYDALPYKVQPGDYLEIRRIERPEIPTGTFSRTMGSSLSGPAAEKSVGGEALKNLAPNSGRDAYIFRVGEDNTNVPISQIQVPESVASAFRFQHRLDVEVVRVLDPNPSNIDFIELRFSQYLGRADMWRLAMSLEGTTVHVGERLTLAGGAVRAEVQAVWRSQHRHSSGILTAKTKTIYRSKSAQVYLFIQLCQETWEFDEDGERYYEKVVHGFLPEIFARWNEKGASHLVTIILFARVHYTDEEVAYLRENDLTLGLIKDYAGKWSKDFFRVIVDFERRTDWNLALAEIKRRIERSEREILLDFHLAEMKRQHPNNRAQKRVVGKWSFAYEGNVLEAVNLALNPFDEHYVDRDLSRTGLNITVITPGTGHFAVDKNLLRMTTERMIDHGICLELVCLTKMPLHSVPLFSYVSRRPKHRVHETSNTGVKTKPSTPDLLYFDAHLSSATDCELADCYSIPKWVNSSFYSKTHDKPFRKDRFVPRCKMYEIQMLGILDHNLTTVTVPLLDLEVLPKIRKEPSPDQRRSARDAFDASIFQSAVVTERDELLPINSRESGATNSNLASYQSARLLAVKDAESRPSASVDATPIKGSPQEGLENARKIGLGLIDTAKNIDIASPFLHKTVRSGSTASRSPFRQIRDQPQTEALGLQRTDVGLASPDRSSLGVGKAIRARSQTQVSETTLEGSSGQSTPKLTPAKKLNTKSSKSSMTSRLGGNWLMSMLTSVRSQPSFPTAAVETVTRTDVSSITGNRSPSPVTPKLTAILPRPVPGAPVVTPSTPTPSKITHAPPPEKTTQPVPIASRRHRMTSDDEPIRSFKGSFKASRSPLDSWSKAAASNFNRGKSHVTVNPCNPKENDDSSFGEGRRWQHVRPKPAKDSTHLVKWTALTAPACLPLTTDFMPTTQEIQDFYEFNSYDIACYPDQVSFLVRSDAATTNLPLAVMREMASQRLSQNFQFITLPHNHDPAEEEDGKPSATRKVLLPGDSTKDGLRVGGASEVLRNAKGAIYLLWSNHIHRLAFDSRKQSVTVQRFVRKLRYSMEPAKYTCLVWPAQMKGFQGASATFKYPNLEAKLNFNYLDRLIAGEEEDLTSNLRYWRTRYILIPSGRDPVAGVVPKGEQFNQAEILISGAFKVLEIIGKNQWKPSGQDDIPLRLLPTTFDPSACVLDDGLMIELDRLNKGEEQRSAGKALEGMTLQTVAEMMCQPNNGLVIRDRWWNFNVHEDSFTGEQFCNWLLNTYTDVKSLDEANEWGRSLFGKGLIEHVTAAHGFFNYGHFFYRLRREYDLNRSKRKKPAKSWFGGKPAQDPRDLLERHAAMPNLTSMAPLGKLGGILAGSAGALGGTGEKKRKIKMSQSVVVDLDPFRKSDRAEVAVLHADIIHNARNAFHFELNWLGVTAGLLEELRLKCAAQAERYGLRLVEVPVEQIKDTSLKCAYRSAIPIPLALPPPVIPDLHLRLAEQGSSGQVSNWFEYAILTHKFGFVLDVEASNRYPENVQVEYSYRGQTTFEYSQFCHRSGLAMVQCIGGSDGFLWCDNRLFIAAPTKGRGGGASSEAYPNMPVPAKLTKQEEARVLRDEFEAFCNNPEALQAFYNDITPPPPSSEAQGEVLDAVIGEKLGDSEKEKEKDKVKAEQENPDERVVENAGERADSPDEIKPLSGM